MKMHLRDKPTYVNIVLLRVIIAGVFVRSVQQ